MKFWKAVLVGLIGLASLAVGRELAIVLQIQEFEYHVDEILVFVGCYLAFCGALVCFGAVTFLIIKEAERNAE